MNTAPSSVMPAPAHTVATTLHRVIDWLDRHGDIAPEDASFFAVAASLPVQEWTPSAVERAHLLAAGRYRPQLEEAGWDVDLIPTPAAGAFAPQADPANPRARTGESASEDPRIRETEPVEPVEDRPVPTDNKGVDENTLVRIVAAPDGDAGILAPIGHPVRDGMGSIPGARWDGTVGAWRMAVSRESALALRALLTGHQLGIEPAIAARLKDAANTPTETLGPDITLAPNGDEGDERIEIRFAHTTQRQDDVKRMTKAQWDGPAGCWYTDTTQVTGVLKFAAAHGFTTSPTVQTLAERKHEPFDYDLTIDGLRGVPVSELDFVRAIPARGQGKKRVGSLAERLTDYGVESVYDLLSVIPHRYMDRSKQVPIRDLRVGEKVAFLARVTDVGMYDRVKRMVRIRVADGTGDMTITFFNQAWMAFRFRKGDEVVVYGKVDVWSGGGRTVKQMTNPTMDPVGDDPAMIVPVYPQSEKSKVSTWDLHGAAMEAVRRLGGLQDPMPEDLKTEHALMGRLDAFREVHAPADIATADRARTRLAFDELFRMQMALGMRRHAVADETGVVHQPTGVMTGQFLSGLRFNLTDAQKRVLGEVRDDLLRPHPMHRLVQGDVGFGKSAIAFVSLLMTVEGGFQGALMAPTEILATQLHAELADELAKITHPDGRMLVVDFLGGKTRVKEKRRILAGLADGSIDIVVGTHSLFTDDVEFANLGLVVIDEQHRFGVEQRAALRAKGNGGSPDMLLMTATPIPRTSALTVFGDLTVSVLDQAPPGRIPIATTWIPGEPELDVITGSPWSEVRDEVEKGRQAYIVASLVEDNEKIAAASAEAAMESLQAGALTGLRLGLVHGKQPREEREETMQAFKRGELDVLVATTVIEVGVNVPNATVMVVLDATRFGIAQLHQIRGRVGRGQWASRCILTGKAGSSDAVTRMQALCESTDGFYLSEVDLDLRGEGSIFGSRQSGQTDLRVASLRDDKDLLVLARAEADKILDIDPKLARRPGLRNEVRSAIGQDAEEWLTRS